MSVLVTLKYISMLADTNALCMMKKAVALFVRVWLTAALYSFSTYREGRDQRDMNRYCAAHTPARKLSGGTFVNVWADGGCLCKEILQSQWRQNRFHRGAISSRDSKIDTEVPAGDGPAHFFWPLVLVLCGKSHSLFTLALHASFLSHPSAPFLHPHSVYCLCCGPLPVPCCHSSLTTGSSGASLI